MKLMIDTNIFLDVLGKREPFYNDSKTVLNMCAKHIIDGFISASAVTDLFYLIHRLVHDQEIAYNSLGAILDIVKVLPVSNEDIWAAYDRRAKDFEDCLLAVCAEKNGCIGIITRNSKDFSSFNLPCYSPDEFINKLGGKK